MGSWVNELWIHSTVHQQNPCCTCMHMHIHANMYEVGQQDVKSKAYRSLERKKLSVQPLEWEIHPFSFNCRWSHGLINIETFFFLIQFKASFFVADVFPPLAFATGFLTLFSCTMFSLMPKMLKREHWNNRGDEWPWSRCQEQDKRWPEITLGSGVLHQRVRRAKKGQQEAQRRQH